MASALQQVNGYTGDLFYVNNNPDDFATYWKNYYVSKGSGFGAFRDNPDSFGNKIYNFLTGEITSAKNAYQNYIDNWNYQRNQQAAAFANWQTQRREDTAVQRAKEDYEQAGFSPYALLGANYSAPSSAMAFAQDKRGDRKPSEKNEDKLLSSALKILALIMFKKL